MARPTEAGGRRPRQLPRARKRFGQHFLEPAWVARLLDTLHAGPDETWLEIGPGRGALTLPLAARVGRLIAVEVDRDLAAALPEALPPHVRIVCDDILRGDLTRHLAGERTPVRVVGNLPYNISSPILFALLHAAGDGRVLADATLMLQKEVADRLTASPGRGEYGALAIQAARNSHIEQVLVLPPGAFRPPPKVWSAVVHVRFGPPAFEVGSLDTFERIVRGVFQHRRKTLANALAPVAGALGASAPDLIDRAGLDGSKRPETFSPDAFGRLSRAVL